MSATNRGLARQKADFYPTPAWCTRRLIEHLGPYKSTTLSEKTFRTSKRWLEPACGEGAIIKAIEEYRQEHTLWQPLYAGVQWHAIDIRPECKEAIQYVDAGANPIYETRDFLQEDWRSFWDVAITNPPFRLCEAFFKKMRPLAEWTILLTRLNWFGSAERRDMFVNDPPRFIFLLPNRPPFSTNKKGKPGTDATEYCWAVWNGKVDITCFDWLELSSREEKREHIKTIIERSRETHADTE